MLPRPTIVMEGKLGFQSAKYRPLTTTTTTTADIEATGMSKSLHEVHEFEYDGDYFEIELLGSQAPRRLPERYEDTGCKYVGLLFPMIQAALRSVVPHVRNTNVDKISITSRESVVTIEKKYTPKPSIENRFPGIPMYRPPELVLMEWFTFTHQKVAIRGTDVICFQKVVSSGQEHSACTEISMLVKVGYHPNVCLLRGLVVEDTGRISGFLTLFRSGRTLYEIEKANEERKKKWKTQIDSAVKHVHARGAVWGDVKPSNVVVDDEFNVVLVDFEGGYTEGWVDSALAGTMEGDKQGCEKMYRFIEGLPEE